MRYLPQRPNGSLPLSRSKIAANLSKSAGRFWRMASCACSNKSLSIEAGLSITPLLNVTEAKFKL